LTCGDTFIYDVPNGNNVESEVNLNKDNL